MERLEGTRARTRWEPRVWRGASGGRGAAAVPSYGAQGRQGWRWEWRSWVPEERREGARGA
eukprot:scaffold156870_cov36-Prasinocladus_malaysianus.AAC.1